MRNFGVERAIEIAEHTASRPHPYVVGFSLAGDEAGYPPEPYAEAYRIAADAGLGLHGARRRVGRRRTRCAARSSYPLRVSPTACARSRTPTLVAELARRQITLEVCPTSNVVLGVFPSYEEHPFPVLREAGIPLTLGSDDPPYFGASVGGRIRDRP